VPYFYPEQAKAAIEAGCHVYMAKPMAVDVPGLLTIEAAAKQAAEKKLCMLVDYQLPTEQPFLEVATRVRDGALGKIVHLASFGMAWHAWPDPPIGPTIESRLTGQIWLSDTALSGDTIVSYDIHIIDGIVFIMGKRPVSACGIARTCRPEPHGDRTDALGVVYEFDDGTIWTHVTQALDNQFDVTTLSASLFGMSATARIQYGGKVFVRGGPKHYAGQCGSLFDQGVIKNIATFHQSICDGKFDNPTVKRALDGHYAAILGREAAARKKFLTLDELVKENKKIEPDLKGLKA
jgi:predicted dehydrogenase